ncbi:autotransporter domain-containing protein, partial [Bacteroides ovatus]
MKLRLPLKLLSALLPFYAISGFHVFAATEWDGSRYSGNIYTWVGSSSNDFHNGGIVLTNPDGTYGPVNTNWGSVSEEGSIWNLFANETGLSQYNTLRFVASGTEVGDVTVSATNKNPSCSFTPFTMGGLIVEEGASGFSLVPNNNAQRTLILGRAGTEEPVLFTVREDFSLGSSSNAWGPVNVNADWNVLVANGKTLNVYGALNSSGRTITVGGEGFSGTLVLNNAANASMTAEWVITSGSTVRCMNNSALGSGLVTLDGGTLDFNSQTIGSTITLNMSGTGTLQNVTVDGAILSYTSSSGNDGITASNTTWTSGKIDIGRLLQGFSAEGSNTVDLGSNLGANFTVLGLDTGQYRIEGSVLTIEDEAISRVTWVSAGAGGTLEKTVKNAFTLALGEGSAANVSLGYLNGTLTTSGDKVYQITNTGGTKINLSGVYNSGATLPSGNLNYQGDIWMDINGGAFGIISGGVTNEW